MHHSELGRTQKIKNMEFPPIQLPHLAALYVIMNTETDIYVCHKSELFVFLLSGQDSPREPLQIFL